MTAVPRADSSAMLRNMRFTCQFLSPGSFAEYQSDWPLGLLDISQFHTRSNINDQNKTSLCTTRILPHFPSDYEQSLDRSPAFTGGVLAEFKLHLPRVFLSLPSYVPADDLLCNPDCGHKVPVDYVRNNALLWTLT